MTHFSKKSNKKTKKETQVAKKIALFKTATEQGKTVDEYLDDRNKETKDFLDFMEDSLIKLRNNDFFTNENLQGTFNENH